MVLALAIGSASTWLVTQPQQSNRPPTILVDSHIRALLAQKPADVSSSERRTVKPWFTGRVPVSPAVADLTGREPRELRAVLQDHRDELRAAGARVT